MLRGRRTLGFKKHFGSSLFLLLFLIAAMKLRFSKKIQAAEELRSPTTSISPRSKDIPAVRFRRNSYQTRGRRSDMLPSPIFLDENDDRFELIGITDISRKMAGVAAFIKDECCTGLHAESMPMANFLKDLADRLLNYGWPLVSPSSKEKLHIPGIKNTLERGEAVEAMECLARLFDRKAETLRAVQVDQSRQVELAKDLRAAARYTEELLVASRSRRGEALLLIPGDDEDDDPAQPLQETDTPEEAPEAGNAYEEPRMSGALGDHDDLPLDADDLRERLTEIVEPEDDINADSGGRRHAVSGGRIFNGQHAGEKEAWRPALSTVEEDGCTDISRSPEPAAQDSSTSSPAIETPVEAPVDGITAFAASLDLHEGAHDIPRELLGRRLESRSWFETDKQLTELIGEIRQWRDSNPNYGFTTIRGQNKLEDLSDHFCDAKPLGISALCIIGCEHPLDPKVLEKMDYDILRFVRLVLWDDTNGHPEKWAERESFDLVRREIEARKLEKANAEAEAKKCKLVEQHVNGSDVEEHMRPTQRNSIDALAGHEDALLSQAWLNLNDEDSQVEPTTSSSPNSEWMPPFTTPLEYEIGVLENPKYLRTSPSISSDDFTDLLRKAKLQALGAEGDSTGAPLPPRSRMTCPSSADLSAFSRLQGENDLLRNQIATLQAHIESLQEFDDPQEPPKGARSDDIHTHPLQHLVGQQPERSRNPSIQADIDSSSEAILDEDTQRFSRDDYMSFIEFPRTTEPPPSPSKRRDKWCRPFNGMVDRLFLRQQPVRDHPKSRPLIVYEGEEGVPHAYVPTRVLRSSRGRGRIDESRTGSSSLARDKNGGVELDSGYVWPQPGNLSMREV